MTPLRVFHLDTGGCGACGAEVWATVEAAGELIWAPGPAQADVVAVTGALTPPNHAAVLYLYRQFWAERVPIVAVGRCAVDGYPFGKLGVEALAELRVRGKVEACPPVPSIILYALLGAVTPSEKGGHGS